MSKDDPNDGGAVNHFRFVPPFVFDTRLQALLNNLIRSVVEMAHTVEETAGVVGATFAKVDSLNVKVDALIDLVEKLKAAPGGLTTEQQVIVDQMFDTATAEDVSVSAEDVKVSAELA